jgi:hypothetical protein
MLPQILSGFVNKQIFHSSFHKVMFTMSSSARIQVYVMELTNSVELSPSEGVNSFSVTQEFTNILWRQKAHYLVPKSTPLGPHRVRSIQSTPTYPIYLRSILILSSHLFLGLPSGCSGTT